MRRRESHLKRSPYGIEFKTHGNAPWRLLLRKDGSPFQFTSEHDAIEHCLVLRALERFKSEGFEYRVNTIALAGECRKYFRAPAIRPLPANFGQGGSFVS